MAVGPLSCRSRISHTSNGFEFLLLLWCEPVEFLVWYVFCAVYSTTVVLYTDSSWLGWRSRMDDRGYPLRKSLRPTCLHRDGQESRCRGNWRIWGFHAVIVCLHVQVEMKEIRNIVLHSNCLWWHQTIFYIAWSTNQIKFYPSIRIATLCIYCPSTTV